MFFFRARAEKGIARHIDASSVVWTLIDNGKLANQIARLAAIVVKYSVPILYFAVTIFRVLLQGKKNWKKFFDHNLVDLNDNERQELLDRAGSDDRGDKEKEDMKLWEKHVLQTLEAVGDLQQALENLFLQDN